MAKGTKFGSVHTSADLHLIQQNCLVSPAQPKTSSIDVPGMDGTYDTTEVLDGVKYKNRSIEWTFALYPGDDWATKFTEVNNAINGRRLAIVLDDDPINYYEGRITVKKHKLDNMLRQITVSADCNPYKLRIFETVVEKSLTTDWMDINLYNKRKPIHPTITTDGDISIKYGENTINLSEGTHTVLSITLTEGVNPIRVKAGTTANIKITYREGDL